MAYIQKNTPPPTKQLTLTLADFSGGLNNRMWQTKPNEATDLLNMSFYDNTLMEKRIGTVAYDTFNPGSSVVHIDTYKPYNQPDRLIRATSTTVYDGTTAIQTVGGEIYGTNYGGMYVFADGTNIYFYGQFPQTGDTYDVIHGTPINGYVSLKLVNPPSNFTPLDTTHTQGVYNYDYTNKQVWYEPCQQELNDAFKGTNVIPDKGKFLANHGGRLFISGDTADQNNVFMSDIQNPYYFAVTLPVQLPPSGDAVRGIAVFDSSLVIGREHDVYILRGDTNRTDTGTGAEFVLTKLNTHTGFANQRAMALAHNWIFYLGSDGVIYQFGQTLLGRININEGVLATQILSVNLDLFKDPLNFTYDDIRSASAFFHNEEWHLSIGGKVLVYSFRTKAFTLYNNLLSTCYTLINDTMVWSRSDGQTGTWGTNYLDFGYPYQGYWTSSRLYMGDPSMFKQFREFYIVANTFDNFKSDITTTFEVDYDSVNQNNIITNQMSIWGVSKWGDRFIDTNINASIPLIIGRRARALRMTFSCGHFPAGNVDTYAQLEGFLHKAEGTLVYVNDESQYYLYTAGTVPDGPLSWVLQSSDDLNQPMRIYQVNGVYEFRGRR